MAVTDALQSTTQHHQVRNDDEEYYEPPPGPPPGHFLPSPLHPVKLPLVLPQHQYNLAVQGWTTVTLSGADPEATEMSKCIEELFAASKHFFSLPESYKSKFQTGDGSEEGWSSIPGEKEFITLRRLNKIPEELRDAAVNAWSRVFGGLLDQTLARVEGSLELEPSSLTRFAEACANLDDSKRATMLRLFRYEGWEDKVVAEPHNDLGLLSLVAGDSPGLEVWNSQNRSFFPIEKLYETTGPAATLLAGRQLQRLTNGRYVPGRHLVRSYPQPQRETISATAPATDAIDEPRYRYSIVFVLRAHSPVIIDTDNLTSRITGEHREPIKGATAHELFLKIKNAHYNINTGIQDREEQKQRIEEKKKQAIETSANTGIAPAGPKDGDSVV